jgi:hypothetical protein
LAGGGRGRGRGRKACGGEGEGERDFHAWGKGRQGKQGVSTIHAGRGLRCSRGLWCPRQLQLQRQDSAARLRSEYVALRCQHPGQATHRGGDVVALQPAPDRGRRQLHGRRHRHGDDGAARGGPEHLRMASVGSARLSPRQLAAAPAEQAGLAAPRPICQTRSPSPGRQPASAGGPPCWSGWPPRPGCRWW